MDEKLEKIKNMENKLEKNKKMEEKLVKNLENRKIVENYEN